MKECPILGPMVPFVVLIGWANARASQLAAYERLWRGIGADTVGVIPDVRRGLFDRDAYPRAMRPIAQTLIAAVQDARPTADVTRDPDRTTRPVLVHVFSDNGMVGWAALTRVLGRTAPGRAVRDAICGVVFDSCPGLWAVRGPLDFARRFATAMTPVVARRLGTSEASLPFLEAELGRGPNARTPRRIALLHAGLTAGFVAYQPFFRGPVRVMKRAAHDADDHGPRCPRLFLYGQRDALVPAADIERWISRARRGGHDVTSVPFAEGRHVALYTTSPMLYRDSLNGFFARVTRAKDATPVTE